MHNQLPLFSEWGKWKNGRPIRRDRLNRTVSLGILLAALWLLLSGHYTPLMMGFGVVSVLFTLYLTRRLNLIDDESHPIHLTFKLFYYWARLFKRIVIANIDVALIIVGVRKPSPQLIRIPMEQKDDLGKVIYANSITLTPGSASIHMENGDLLVHTLSSEGAADLFEGDMARIQPNSDVTGKQDADNGERPNAKNETGSTS